MPARSRHTPRLLLTREKLRSQLNPAWMIRDIRLLLLARVAMSSVRSLTSVIVPIYLTLLGFSAVRLGLLFALAGITSAALTASIGILSDRIGRKAFLVGMPLLTGLAGIAFIFSRSEALIFAFAALGSFGRGGGAGGGTVGPYAPAEQAFMAGRVPDQARNSVFGRMAFASAVGAVGGNILASIPALAARTGLHGLNSYRPAFAAVALLAIAGGLLATPILDARPARRQEKRALHLSPPSRSLLLKLWGTNSVNGIAIGFVGPFLTLWFYRRYGVGPGTIGLLYTAINLASMVSILSAANLAHRLGLVRTVVIGRVFQGLLLIPMVLAPTFWIAGGIYLLRMLAQRVAMPLRQSFVMGMASPEERGTIAGLSNLPSQATSVLTPTPAGYLFDHVSLALPFEIGAAMQFINAMLYLVFFRGLAPPEEVARRRGEALGARGGRSRATDELPVSTHAGGHADHGGN